MLARLRESEPVSWIPALDGWLVTSRDLCVEVLRDPETFTVDDPRFSTQQVVGPSMLSLDGSEHRRHRAPFIDPFRSETVRSRLSAWTQGRAEHLVGEIAPLGGADLRASLAAPLSAEVMSFVLDLEEVGVADLLAWYEAIVGSVDAVTEGGVVPESGREAFRDLHAAVTSSVPHSSLLSSVHAKGALSIDEIVSNVAVLLFGGIVTSESTIATAFQQLLKHPDVFQQVVAERSLVGNVLEESMRLEPGAAVVDRYSRESVTLGSVRIDRGDLVRLSLAAANRDASVYSDPDRFDVHRDNVQQHLTFARGPHTCIGIHVARLQARAAVDAALDGLGNLRLDPTRNAPTQGLIFRAPVSVEALWDPR